MNRNPRRTVLARVALAVGAVAVLVIGADHLQQYTVNMFSTVPTIAPLFLLNFIAATVVGVGLLLPLGVVVKRLADPIRTVLALSGIGLAASSLVALWISETWSLFGFTDYGFRPAIVTAIVAEAVAVVALSAYLALAGIRAPRVHRRAPAH